VLHITLKNIGDGPFGLILNSHSASERNARGILADPTPINGYRLFMVTRRSIANPGELVKFRAEFSRATTSYPETSVLQLKFGDSDYGSDHYSAFNVPLHGFKR
jgi:hypothetical protein